MNQLLTEAEAAELLRIPERTLRHLRAVGRISYVRVSARNIAYREDHIEDFIAGCTTRNDEAPDPVAKGRKRPVSNSKGRSAKIVPFSQRSRQ